MEEDIFGKSSLKTYSRAKSRRGTSDNAVFMEKALQSLKEKLSPPDDAESTSMKGKRKRYVQRNKSCISETGSVKKLKQGKNKKAILQVKIQKKASVKSLSPLQDSYENDVLFGAGLQPIKVRKKPRARKPQAGTPKQNIGGRQKRASVSKSKSQEQSKISLSETSTSEKLASVGKLRSSHGEHSDSFLESRSPPGSELRPEDKVSNWLAKTDTCRSHDDSSKEVWRQEQQLTGGEIRSKLFPDEFFQNLNCVVQKPKSALVSRHVKARQDEFLAQLALTNVVGPKGVAAEMFMKNSDEDVEDTTLVYSSTQSGLQTDTQTGTGSQMVTGTGSFSTFRGTGTSRFSDKQSHGQTGTGTQMETGTYSFPTGTGTSRYTECETQSRGRTGTGTQNFSFPTTTGTSSFTQRETQSHGKTSVARVHKDQLVGTPTTGTNNYTDSVTVYTDTDVNQDTHTDPLSKTKSVGVFSSGRRNSWENKKQSKPETTEREQTFTCKVPNIIPKYLCSTMRRSASLNNDEFPSELSAVTDSLRNKQQDEKTPRRATEAFKVPGSPTKFNAFKGMRKGTLQPKNSTKLFTTGFVEIVDVIPQMSTITCEHSSKATVIEDIEREAPKPKQRKQNIKTSTPNKVDSQGQAFQFEVDISSVNMDSDDDDLHFHESREVNSEECIHLSDTLIDTQQDREAMQTINADLQASRETGNIEPAKTGMPLTADDGTITKAHSGKKPRKSARKEASTIEKSVTKISPKTKNKKKGMKEKSDAESDRSKPVNRKVPKTRKQTKFGGLKKCLRNQSARSRFGSAVSGTSWQSGYCRKSTSSKLSRNIQTTVNVSNRGKKFVDEQKKCDSEMSRDKTLLDKIRKDVYNIDESDTNTGNVVKANGVSVLDNDVFDIDESAKNVPSPESQKLARKAILSFKKSKKKKASAVNKQQAKRKSGEISFNPKGPLNFNSISYSTLASKSLGSLFRTSRQNSSSKDQCPPLKCNSTRYSCSTLASKSLGSLFHTNSKTVCPEPQRRVGVPVCTLLDEDFSCPRVKIPLVIYKTTDTRSNQEILNTVPIDSLMM